MVRLLIMENISGSYESRIRGLEIILFQITESFWNGSKSTDRKSANLGEEVDTKMPEVNVKWKQVS